MEHHLTLEDFMSYKTEKYHTNKKSVYFSENRFMRL